MAEVILCLASDVNLRAHTLSPYGTLRNLISLVTVPTIATILLLNLVFPSDTVFLSFDNVFTILEIDIGYLLSLD